MTLIRDVLLQCRTHLRSDLYPFVSQLVSTYRAFDVKLYIHNLDQSHILISCQCAIYEPLESAELLMHMHMDSLLPRSSLRSRLVSESEEPQHESHLRVKYIHPRPH